MTNLQALAADRLYAPWEESITSWSGLQHWVNHVTSAYPQVEIVWRGARRAEWGLTTSLYRALMSVLGTPPTEEQTVRAEANALNLARREWRYDHLGALELFAHIQHLGGPTRLLDVSANPLIAAWFAVERSEQDDHQDGRLFAFSVGKHVDLKPEYAGRLPRWHQYRNDELRRSHSWGTGDGRRLWRPPAYNNRIAAQNSAFILDGVPLADALPPRLAADAPEKWNLDDLRLISAFNFRPSSLMGTSARSPIFTARVLQSCKEEIRHNIEDRYGYSAASLYSDLGGLASYLARRPEILLDPDKS